MTANPIAQYPQTGGTASLPSATAAGQVLTSTGAGTTYTAQAPASSLISKQILVSAVASVSFNSIPQTFTNLKLFVTATATSASSNLSLTFNSDSGTNYTYNLQLNSNGSGPPFYAYTPATTLINLMPLGQTAPNSTSAETTIFDYIGTVFTKNVISTATPPGATGGYLAQGFWNSTAAITSITLTSSAGNFAIGSTFSLYGLS